jgi:hypothetical protein
MSRVAQLQSALARARDRVAQCRARLDDCRTGGSESDCAPYRWQLAEARRAYSYLEDECERARQVEGL